MLHYNYTDNYTCNCAMIVTALFHFTDAKRLIGRKFDDHVVQSDMKHWPFKVVSDGGKPKVEVEYKGEVKTFYPEEVSSMVLTKMKEISEAYLGKVRKRIITKVWVCSISKCVCMCIDMCMCRCICES